MLGGDADLICNDDEGEAVVGCCIDGAAAVVCEML